MMKRKEYRRPVMRVVELRQQCHILAGSNEQQSGGQRTEYESEEW